MFKRGWFERGVAVMLVSAQLSACSSWHVETVSPAEVVEDRQPAAIRVQHRDRRSEVLYLPEIRGDSLLGRREWNAKQSDRAVALADVSGVATRRLSAARTAGLVIGIGAVVGVIVGLSAMQGGLEHWGQ